MSGAVELQSLAADALVEVRAYGMSDPIRSVVRLMDALEAQYKADFENVTTENLVRLQTAIKQVTAIRRAIVSEHHLDPKIL